MLLLIFTTLFVGSLVNSVRNLLIMPRRFVSSIELFKESINYSRYDLFFPQGIIDYAIADALVPFGNNALCNG